MHELFTDSAISRRQFLQTLLALGSSLLLPSGSNAARPIVPAYVPEPFWWSDLSTEKLEGPSGTKPCFGMPGGLMYLVTAAALLEEGMLTPSSKLVCRGRVNLNGKQYRCPKSHGTLTLSQALAVSCKVCFAQAGEVLNTHRFLHYAEAFQLNKPTPDDAGFIFPEPFSLDHPSHQYVLGLSRSMQPNTAQLIRMTRLIANKDIAGLKPSTWQVLHQGMRMAATYGSAHRLDTGNRLKVAAKTGLAPLGESTQSWVLGFFPFDNPKYAFCLRACENTDGETALSLTERVLNSRLWR